jgi:hypothetical protein
MGKARRRLDRIILSVVSGRPQPIGLQHDESSNVAAEMTDRPSDLPSCDRTLRDIRFALWAQGFERVGLCVDPVTMDKFIARLRSKTRAPGS